MTYGDFKDLPKKTAADKVLRDKSFNIAKINGNQRGLASMAYNFFNKKTSDGAVKSEIMPNYRNLEKRKVCSSFIENIWGADLLDMQLISKFNEGFQFLLCIIDIYGKYVWVAPLKDKKVLQLLKFFKKY